MQDQLTQETAPVKPVKKKKLTPAERKAKKLELRRLKQIKLLEDKKNAFRAHLARELKYSKLTEEKATKDWISLCADSKLPELQIEVEAAFQRVQSILDRKNHTIEELLDQLDIANNQYKTNLQQHCDQIEKLIKIYNFFLNTMRTIYDSECFLIVDDFHKETFGKQKVMISEKAFYENIMHESNSDTSKELDEMFESFVFKKNEKMNKSLENCFVLRNNFINKMNDIHKAMISNYNFMKMNSASPKREQMTRRLKIKEEQANTEFTYLVENAIKAQAKIHELQKTLLDIETKQQHKISDLKHERSYFVECYWILKTKAIGDIRKDDKQLKLLATNTRATVTELKNLKRYGELIIGLASVSRKLQTQKEKVMPWPQNIIPDDMEYSEDLKHLNLMELFWYKVSLAKTHNIALKKEKEKLLREKETLMGHLKAYCHSRTMDMITDVIDVKKTSTVTTPVQEAAHLYQIQQYFNK